MHHLLGSGCTPSVFLAIWVLLCAGQDQTQFTELSFQPLSSWQLSAGISSFSVLPADSLCCHLIHCVAIGASLCCQLIHWVAIGASLRNDCSFTVLPLELYCVAIGASLCCQLIQCVAIQASLCCHWSFTMLQLEPRRFITVLWLKCYRVTIGASPCYSWSFTMLHKL